MKEHDIPRSGKRGDRVWQRGRHGQYSYPLTIPANPRTPAQRTVRGVFGEVSARWRKLTEAQRQLWCVAARTVKSKPRLQQGGPLFGCQLFVKINAALAYYGRPQVDEPPPRPRFPQLAVSGVVITGQAGVIRIRLVCPGDPGDHTILRASAPQRARRETCTDFRFIGFCPAPVGGSVDITERYVARFGVPRPGTKLFFRFNQLFDGWEGKERQFSAIVPAPAPGNSPKPTAKSQSQAPTQTYYSPIVAAACTRLAGHWGGSLKGGKSRGGGSGS